MRTIDRLSSTAAVSWLRGGAGRMRRALMARSPAVRLALVLAPVLMLAAVGYWVAATLAPSGSRYLAIGRPFSSEDLKVIRRNFDGKGISYRADGPKVEVAADQFGQAIAVLAKLNVGPRPIDEIRETSDSIPDILGTPEDKERRARLQTEKIIEAMIDDLEGVVRSVVLIQHPRVRIPRNLRVKPSALVRLECEPSRQLPLQTLQAIPKILMNSDPELGADAITIMDLSGRPLLDPGNPELGKLTRVRAREQELRDRVAEQLAWIPGVRITVALADRGEAMPAQAGPARPDAAGPRVEGRGAPAPSISVNQPAELGEPEPPPPPRPTPVETPERGRVFVYVPRSHYYRMMLPRPDDREPSVTELHQVAVKTQERVESMVKPVIPETCTLEVDTIPDDVPMTRTSALPAEADHRRIAADWGIIGAVAAAVALLMALGSWIQAARRPSRLIESPPAGRRYREDAADEPGPSERVRELVRRDPEVAASVLQRWATQGGRVS